MHQQQRQHHVEKLQRDQSDGHKTTGVTTAPAFSSAASTSSLTSVGSYSVGAGEVGSDASASAIPNDRARSVTLPLPLGHTGGDRWYESARFILAPLVNQSDVVFRMMARKYGADVCYTQMLESDKFVQDETYRQQHFWTCREDRPLVVQFATNDVDTFVRAALMVQPFCDAVDLNLGCPQRHAKTHRYGAYLLDEEYHPLVMNMVRAARNALHIPIFVKIRLLPSLEQTLTFCRSLQCAGAHVITIHGRTRGFVEERRKGPADLQQIRALAQALSQPFTDTQGKTHQPVVVWGNGNVRCDTDVLANLATTTCNGYMVGEAMLNDPTLFSRCVHPDRKTSDHEQAPVSAPMPTHSVLAVPNPVSLPSSFLLTIDEFRRKLTIMNEYVHMLQHPQQQHEYFTPFALSLDVSATTDSPTTSSSFTTTTSTSDSGCTHHVPRAPSSLLSTPIITDETFRTPLLSFSSFLSHLYRFFNGDIRSRFLSHTQLRDDFLDCASPGAIRSVLSEVERRIAQGYVPDERLQMEIDAQRGLRQQKRAAMERKRKEQQTGIKIMNSKQRKRARYNERKREEKRQKQLAEQRTGGSEATTIKKDETLQTETTCHRHTPSTDA